MAESIIEKLDDDELQGIVTHEITDAALFVDGELSTDRATATDYYLGRPLGNEEEGRNQIVMTEVRDAVHGIMPSLMRVFFAGERVVEFEPTNAGNVRQAAERTDYINKVLERNGFFLTAQACLLDGLIRRMGVVKWGWDDTSATEAYHLASVPHSQLEQLITSDGVSVKKATTVAQPAQQPDSEEQGEQPDPQQAPPEPMYEVDFTYTRKTGCAKIWSIPPEELLFNREARDQGTAVLMAHRTKRKRGDLIAMGISAADLEEFSPGSDLQLQFTGEEAARRAAMGTTASVDPESGKANDQILYSEAYIRIDADGDGIPELRLFKTIGLQHHITNGKGRGEPVTTVPFGVFCPFPEPHTMLGQGMTDLTADLQRLSSNVVRSTMDSLTLALYPRMKVVEGQATMSDVLNTDTGAPIRVRNIDAVQSFTHPFVGGEAIPFMGVIADIVERRTGMSKGAQGLDSDALQSSTDEAVGANLSSSQAQMELICRNFAEQVMKPLMLGVSRLYTEYQPEAETVRLRGEWVTLDPRMWDEDLDVVVNVGLGTTETSQKVAFFMSVAAKQAEIISSYGLTNPLCGLPEYRRTLAQIAMLKGVKDLTDYFKEFPSNWQPPPPPAPVKSPQQMQVEGELQISQMKTDRDFTIKQAELELKKAQMLFDQQLALETLAQNSTLKRYAIDAQFKTAYTQMQFEQDTAANEREVQGHLDAQQQTHNQAVDAHNQALATQQQQTDQAQQAQQQQHDQAISQQQADQAPAPGGAAQ